MPRTEVRFTPKSSRSLRNSKLIIRRITESLKAQDFTIVAIELFILIVGVFVGIQVSNWNDARIDQTRAHSYLERIRADLDADILNYHDRMRFWEEVSEYGAQGLSYARSGNLGDLAEWDLLLAYFQTSQLAEFYTTRTTYEELKSGGELGLIDDIELRNSFTYYYTTADNPVLTERPAYREHVRGKIPLHIQNYIWDNCYTSNELGIQKMRACEAPVDGKEAALIIEAISGDHQLMSELRYWMSTMRVALFMGRDRTAYATRLRDSIDTKIDGVSAIENP